MIRKPPRLLVIDPSVHDPEDQGVREVVADWPGGFAVRRPALDPAQRIGSREPYDADGIVLLGSAASVHDPEPWARDLAAWVTPLVRGEVEIPLLGVCYGHQLVAHLAGGAVEFLDPDKARRRGVETSRFSGSRLIPGEQDLEVVVSHRETVPEVPRGFRATASRPGVPVDALEHGHLPIFTVQFHPEAREEFAGRRGIPVERIDRRVREDGSRLLRAFRDLILDRVRRGGSGGEGRE